MQRPIKFRAWNKSTETILDLKKITALALNNHLLDGLYIPNDPQLILMQYTGLKDKNGKEIYESDLVTALFYEEKEPFLYHIIWNPKRGGFALQRGDREFGGYPLDIHGLHNMEIIGNIYENPELSDNPLEQPPESLD